MTEESKPASHVVEFRNVTKIYDPEGVNVMAVDDCSMEIAAGEVCMIVGPSGCGKTTLLRIIAAISAAMGVAVSVRNPIPPAIATPRGDVILQASRPGNSQ